MAGERRAGRRPRGPRCRVAGDGARHRAAARRSGVARGSQPVAGHRPTARVQVDAAGPPGGDRHLAARGGGDRRGARRRPAVAADPADTARLRRRPGVERPTVDGTRRDDRRSPVRWADPRRRLRRGRWEPGGGPGPGHGSFGLDSACGDDRRADRCEHAARWASPPDRLDLPRTGVVGPLVGPALRPVDRRRAADRPDGGKSVRVGDGDDGRWARAHRRRPLEPGDRRGPRQRRDLRSRHQCLQPHGVDAWATDRACTDAAR